MAAEPLPRPRRAPLLRRLLWRLESGLAGALFAFLRLLPPQTASQLGGFVARSLGPRLPVSHVAERNLRRALPGLEATARKRIIREVWDNLGRTMAEFPHLARLAPTPSGPGFEVVGGEVLEAMAARGGPVIFVSAHYGNWEMLPPIVARYGIPMASFYRALANPFLDRRIGALRAAAMGAEAVSNFPKGASGAKAAFAHLARGGYLGLLVDQKLNDGIEARFFGLPAMTAPAPASFALRFRCPIVPGRIDRLGPARFRLTVEPPLEPDPAREREAEVARLTQAINDRLEAWIRARPGHWLWLHRRWPEPPRPDERENEREKEP
jgi:KDO2-lipid IV(A) lauroyltransferase